MLNSYSDELSSLIQSLKTTKANNICYLNDLQNILIDLMFEKYASDNDESIIKAKELEKEILKFGFFYDNFSLIKLKLDELDEFGISDPFYETFSEITLSQEEFLDNLKEFSAWLACSFSDIPQTCNVKDENIRDITIAYKNKCEYLMGLQLIYLKFCRNDTLIDENLHLILKCDLNNEFFSTYGPVMCNRLISKLSTYLISQVENYIENILMMLWYDQADEILSPIALCLNSINVKSKQLAEAIEIQNSHFTCEPSYTSNYSLAEFSKNLFNLFTPIVERISNKTKLAVNSGYNKQENIERYISYAEYKDGMQLCSNFNNGRLAK